MRTDEDVGRVAVGALVCISKSLELFIQEMLSATVASLRGDKKITLTHLKKTVHSVSNLDFLKDLVSSEPRKVETGKGKRAAHKDQEESVEKKIKIAEDDVKEEESGQVKEEVDDQVKEEVDDQVKEEVQGQDNNSKIIQ